MYILVQKRWAQYVMEAVMKLPTIMATNWIEIATRRDRVGRKDGQGMKIEPTISLTILLLTV